MKSGEQQSGWWSFLSAVLIGRRPKWTFVRIVVLVALIFLVVRPFVLTPIRSVGPSMMPTYQDGGVNFVYRLAYLSRHPQRGDVVAIRYAGPSVMLMKRVIGLPGETISFRGGHAFINGQSLDEPYVKYPCDWESAPEMVKPGHYFVVGDNRSMPTNYHYFGQAEADRIIGKILLCKNLFASSPPQR